MGITGGEDAMNRWNGKNSKEREKKLGNEVEEQLRNQPRLKEEENKDQETRR